MYIKTSPIVLYLRFLFLMEKLVLQITLVFHFETLLQLMCIQYVTQTPGGGGGNSGASPLDLKTQFLRFFQFLGLFSVFETFRLFWVNLRVFPHQVIIAQWLAWRLATGEVPGSNPGKGENLLISN